MSIPLDSFSIDFEGNKTIIVNDNNHPATDVHFKLLYPDSDHITAVCLRNYSKEISASLIPLNAFLV
jgi:hypothetical protein